MVRGGAHRGAQDHQEGQTLSGQVAGLFVAAGHVGARDALLAPRPSRYEPALAPRLPPGSAGYIKPAEATVRADKYERERAKKPASKKAARKMR